MKRFLLLGVAAIAATVPMAAALPSGAAEQDADPTLVEAVREATHTFRDPADAIPAGYAPTGTCVSGPQEGAMGVHYVNGALIEDPAVDPFQPEILVYEPRNGRLRLAGVEYLVLAEAWNDPEAGNPPGAPVVLGQLFQFVGSPNRYGLPAFYELHVWAWKANPLGVFADFNANISCEQYVGDTAANHTGHG